MNPPHLSLDELAADPQRVAALPAEAVPSLLAQTAALQSALAARLIAAPNCTAPEPAEDRLLTCAEAAQALHVSQDWLYRRAARLPFTVRLGRPLRFSAAGIARYLRQRQGRGA